MKKIKIRAQINEIENTKATERTEETKRWFSEKINKIDKTSDLKCYQKHPESL